PSEPSSPWTFMKGPRTGALPMTRHMTVTEVVSVERSTRGTIVRTMPITGTSAERSSARHPGDVRTRGGPICTSGRMTWSPPSGRLSPGDLAISSGHAAKRAERTVGYEGFRRAVYRQLGRQSTVERHLGDAQRRRCDLLDDHRPAKDPEHGW